MKSKIGPRRIVANKYVQCKTKLALPYLQNYKLTNCKIINHNLHNC